MEIINLASFERLTGLAYFTPTAPAGPAIPFGNITMLKLATNPKTVEVPLAKRGNLILARRDLYQVSPVYEITSDQFATPTFPLQIMGDQLADTSQASNVAATFTFTAAHGNAYLIGAYNVLIATVKVAAATKVLGTDYYVDDPNIPQSLQSLNGVIILPVTPAGISDADSVVVTFNQPAILREQFVAFTKLNRSGTLVVFAEDATGADAREIWTMTVQLSAKSVGDIDANKFREGVLEASIFGNPIITRKKA